MSKDSYHVLPDLISGWVVKKYGSSRAIKKFDSQQSAIEYARNISIETHGELYIHQPDGSIRSKDSFRSDPPPPKEW